MKNNDTGKLSIKIFLLSIGLLIMGLGTVLLYRSTLGTSPMATASDGLSRIFGISYGTSNTLLNIFFLILSVLINRKNIGIGTVITVFSLGLYINLWSGIIPDLSLGSSMASKIIISLLGTMVVSIGTSFYIQFNIGVGPLECLVDFIYEKTNWEYKKSKTIFDILLLFIGILMGGVYGLGTVLNVVLVGRLMQFFISLYDKHLVKLYKVIL